MENQLWLAAKKIVSSMQLRGIWWNLFFQVVNTLLWLWAEHCGASYFISWQKDIILAIISGNQTRNGEIFMSIFSIRDSYRFHRIRTILKSF